MRPSISMGVVSLDAGPYHFLWMNVSGTYHGCIYIAVFLTSPYCQHELMIKHMGKNKLEGWSMLQIIHDQSKCSHCSTCTKH